MADGPDRQADRARAGVARRDFLKTSARATGALLALGASSDEAPADAAQNRPRPVTWSQSKRVPSNLISLPKSGAAVAGLGETFVPNLQSGTESISIPIPLSKGRDGFDPQLTLSYSIANGNGPFGMGWTLDLPEVARGTQTRLPRYRDDDVFLLEGAEMRADESSPPVTRGGYEIYTYRLRHEGPFSRIERWVTRSPARVSFWRVTTKDNITRLFGATDEAIVADPSDPRRVFRWALQLAYDGKGNAIHYLYKREDGAGVEAHERDRAVAQTYLKRIRYGNLSPLAFPSPADAVRALARGWDASLWFFEAALDYGEHRRTDAGDSIVTGDMDEERETWRVRDDAFSSFRSGFEIRTRRVCTRVLMFHRVPGMPGPSLVGSLDLVTASPSDRRGFQTVTLLEEAIRRGYAPCTSGETNYSEDYEAGTGRGIRSGSHCVASLPPLAFCYSAFEPPTSADQMTLQGEGNMPTEGLTEGNLALVDLFQRGLPDVLRTGGSEYFYWKNLGGGRFASQASLGAAPRGARPGQPVVLADRRVGFGELTSDGFPDLLVDTRGAGCCVGRRGSPSEPPRWLDYQPFAARLPFQLTDGNVRLIDLNGDGRLDILRSTSRHFELFESEGQRGFKKPQVIPRSALDRFPNVDFDDPRVHFADMTGDGLVDIVLVAQREIHYWPNLGFGRFGGRVTMRHSPRGPFERGRLYFIDIDGSGPADLVYVDSGRVECWLNRAGNEWTDRFFVNDTPRLIDEPPQPVDLLGSGVTGLLWSSASGLKGYSYLPLSRTKPFLLTRVDNGMGRRVEYTYEPSTTFALKAGAGLPWDEPLPFPVYVLSRIERHDDITRSRLVSTFSYAHGAYDSAEKAFKGFGRVDQEDTEHLSAQAPLPPGSDSLPGALHLPPVLTKSWFHTGSHHPDPAVKRHAGEYYAGDSLSLGASTLPAPVSPLLDEEASRSLAGRLLRREVWALSPDPEGPHPAHPYTATEWSFDVQRLQGGAGGVNAVHHVRQSEELRIHYEQRPDDPQVTHECNLLFDRHGHVLESALVAYPRRPAPDRLPEQGRTLATYTVRTYASRDADAGGFRHGVVSEEQSYELVNLAAGGATLLTKEHLVEWFRSAAKTELDAEPQPGIRQARLIAHTRHRFWNDEGTAPLPAGDVGLLALPHNTCRKALTPGLLETVYGSKVDEALAREGGYQRDEDGAWWAPDGDPRAERGSVVFDLQHFCLPVQWNDPLGRTSSARYDPCWLAPVETTDPLRNVTTAEVDYHTLLPKEIRDFNGNRTFIAFDALGRVAGTALAGRADAAASDSLRGFRSNLDRSRVRAYLDDPLSMGPALLADATTRTVHDAWAYDRARRSGGDAAASPTVICTLAREAHVADLAPGTSAPVQHTFVYRDGFGRELQTKVRAAPGLTSTGRHAAVRWIGSGATLYDNKGNVIKKYEPFFSSTHRFDTDAALTRWGVTPVFHYDPLGRLVRTDKPDGTFTRVTRAPWHEEQWDEVDTVLESAWERDRAGSANAADRRAAELSRRHAGTPFVTHVDGLRRSFLTVSDNSPLGRYSTLTTFDIQGNATRVTDPRGNTCAASDFDMLGRLLRTRSIDSGDRSRLPNAWGDPIREWDGAGRLVRRTYDALNRPVEVFVRRDNEAERLVERLVYGEGVPGAEARGLRGELHEVHTEAGILRNVAFDFKGNIKESAQWLWQPGPTTIEGRSEADAETFSRTTSYDALNRPIAVRHPDGGTTETTYDELGNVRRVEVRRGGTPVARVDNVEYNARRQRTLLVYGNGVRVEYRYERETFRLAHMAAVRPDGAKLQDMSYTYDAAGNVVEIVDRAQEIAFFKNEPVEPRWLFEYDAVYRLTLARGREHASLGLPSAPDRRPAPVSVPSPPPRGRGAARSHPNDSQALTRYCEEYAYDPAGNLLSVRHRSATGTWTQRYEYPLTSNRLAACGKPDRMAAYSHDGNGNVTTMPHANRIEWDYADRLRVYGEGDALAFYAYDVEGSRVRKAVERGPVADDRISLGDYERFERRRKGTPELARHTTHVRLGELLVACVESETRRDGRALATAASRTRFQLHDHLGSGRLEVDEAGAVVSYEEYHPFGTSAYRAGPGATEVSQKRFRYRGKELDEESGLYYFGARYYAPWLGRWVSCDPLGLEDGPNLYAYTANNPVRLVDARGLSRSEHQELYGMTSPYAPETVAPQPEPEPSSTSASEAPDARPPDDSTPSEAAGMTDPDSPASVAAPSPYASEPESADTTAGAAEPRAGARDLAAPSERAAENWFSGIQTTVDFGAAFTDPVTGASMGAIGEASAAEGVLNKGHKSEEKRVIIEKVGSREVQGWGIGAGLTVSWIQQRIDPSLVDKGPRISDKSDFRFPIGRGKGRIGNDNVALDVKVSFLSVKLRWGPEHREVGLGVSTGKLVAFTTRGRVETTIRTAPPIRYTGGSWDAPR